MLMHFEEFTKEWDFETDHIEPIIINTDAINCIKPNKHDDDHTMIFLSNGKTAEVKGTMEEIEQAIISATNGSISSSNNRQGSGRPNSKNGS